MKKWSFKSDHASVGASMPCYWRVCSCHHILMVPTETPTEQPTETPNEEPTAEPTEVPTEEPTAEMAPTSAQTVTIVDSAFQPAELTVPVGTTITWIHQGRLTHTVTANDGSFNSGNLRNGDTFSSIQQAMVSPLNPTKTPLEQWRLLLQTILTFCPFYLCNAFYFSLVIR